MKRYPRKLCQGGTLTEVRVWTEKENVSWTPASHCLLSLWDVPGRKDTQKPLVTS